MILYPAMLRAAFLCTCIGVFLYAPHMAKAEPVDADMHVVLSKIETITTVSKTERVQKPCKRCTLGGAKNAHTQSHHIDDINTMIAIASRYVGSRNPTGVRGKWCKAFVNKVLR
jgi:hypothetical protein